MITTIEGLPPFVFGVSAAGEVTKEDMQRVLLPGLQQLVNAYDEIYYLLVLETEIGNFSAASWIDDMKAGIKHFTKWKKIAVVTNQAGVEKFTDIFSFLVPGQSKGYKMSELSEAEQWISTKE